MANIKANDVPNQYTNNTISNESPTTTAQLIAIKDWKGHVNSEYPKTIQSLKTGTFIHVNKVAGAEGDVGAVVYRSKNAGVEYDWVFAWYNSFDQSSQGNAAYTDIIPSGSTKYETGYWEKVYEELILNPTKVTVTKYECQSVASITSDLPSQFNGSTVTKYVCRF